MRLCAHSQRLLLDFGMSNVHVPPSQPFRGVTSTSGPCLGETIALAKLVRYVSGLVHLPPSAGVFSHRSTIIATGAWITVADKCRPSVIEASDEGRVSRRHSATTKSGLTELTGCAQYCPKRHTQITMLNAKDSPVLCMRQFRPSTQGLKP